MGRQNHFMGHYETQNSRRDNSAKIYFTDQCHPQSGGTPGHFSFEHPAGIYPSPQKTFRGTPKFSDTTDDSPAFSSNLFPTAVTLQHDNNSLLASSWPHNGHSRNSSRRLMARNARPNNSTFHPTPPYSSYPRGTMGQGRLGWSQQQHSNSGLLPRARHSRAHHFPQSSLDSSSNATIVVPRDHNSDDVICNSDSLPFPLFSKHPPWRSSASDQIRGSSEICDAPKSASFHRRSDEVRGTTRCSNCERDHCDAKTTQRIKTVRFCPTIISRSFSHGDPSCFISVHYTSSLSPTLKRVSFHPSSSFFSYDVSAPTVFLNPSSTKPISFSSCHSLLRRRLAQTSSQKSSCLASGPPSSTSRVPASSFKNSSLASGFSHPPKILKFCWNPLFFLDYEQDIPLDQYRFSLPSNPRKHNKKSLLSVPLKQVVSSSIHYDVLLDFAAKSNRALFDKYSFLLSIIRDIKVFSSLFRTPPHPNAPGRSSQLSQNDKSNLLLWNIVFPSPRSSKLNYVHFGFKVLKSDPSCSRFILDCNLLNEAMQDPPSFHLPSPILLLSKLLRCNFGWVGDFSGWFFQHALGEEVLDFFGLRVGSSPLRMRKLPQGWKFSPVTAQTSSDILCLDTECKEEDQFLSWIDDIFGGSADYESASQQRNRFILRCNRANAILGELSEVSQTIHYVGIEADLKIKKWRLKPDWVKKASRFISSLSSPCSVEALWTALGLLIWFLRVSLLPLALIDPLIFFTVHLTPLLIKSSLKWHSPIDLWPSVRENIRSSLSLVEANRWRTFSHPPPWLTPQTMIFSDASIKGGAVFFQNQIVWQQEWSFPTGSDDILYLESLAWLAGIRHAINLRSDTHSIVTVVDNEALYFSLIKSRAKNFKVSSIIRQGLDLAAEASLMIFAGWCSTSVMPADAASRFLSCDPKPPPTTEIRISHFPIAVAIYAKSEP